MNSMRGPLIQHFHETGENNDWRTDSGLPSLPWHAPLYLLDDIH
ncbi:MAG: hypothetical protein K0R57_2788 [Paenibacillaceae bacterium]|jgi:hypothetical protein|nr:hypothetical protein [Paenibacillaceae bacterium]